MRNIGEGMAFFRWVSYRWNNLFPEDRRPAFTPSVNRAYLHLWTRNRGRP